MNVLHINTLQTAGAALCAIRINKALNVEGVDSRMLFAEGDMLPNGISGAIAERDKSLWYSYPWLLRLKYWLARLPFWSINNKEKMEVELQRRNRQLTIPLYMHAPFTCYKNIAHHPLIEWADVIHLHWVANFVDYPTFFKEVRKPIVWTLHDKFPLCGALHFESKFYPVPDSLKSLNDYCKRVKREAILKSKSLNVVAISEMMADDCKNSDVLKGVPVSLIHNGVDTEVFHPYDKQKARQELGLPKDAKILLFSANSLDDENKGLDRLLEALQQVNIQDMMLVCIGMNNDEHPIPCVTFPVKAVGYVCRQGELAEYYSAADYFCQCSYIESFGQTVIEAMACGTPVVSTPCGVASEVIKPFNGVLCDDFTPTALAHGISKALTQMYDSEVIRRYVLENFRYKLIASQYIELYKTIIK